MSDDVKSGREFCPDCGSDAIDRGNFPGDPPGGVETCRCCGQTWPASADKRWAQLARDVKDLIVFDNLHPVGDAHCLPVDLATAGDVRSPGPWNQCWLDCAERMLAELLRRQCGELGLAAVEPAFHEKQRAGYAASCALRGERQAVPLPTASPGEP